MAVSSTPRRAHLPGGYGAVQPTADQNGRFTAGAYGNTAGPGDGSSVNISAKIPYFYPHNQVWFMNIDRQVGILL